MSSCGEQEISVYGGEHATASRRPEGQDARYPEDSGDSTISKDEKSTSDTAERVPQADKYIVAGF
jgi:hypothetical protein